MSNQSYNTVVHVPSQNNMPTQNTTRVQPLVPTSQFVSAPPNAIDNTTWKIGYCQTIIGVITLVFVLLFNQIGDELPSSFLICGTISALWMCMTGPCGIATKYMSQQGRWPFIVHFIMSLLSCFVFLGCGLAIMIGVVNTCVYHGNYYCDYQHRWYGLAINGLILFSFILSLVAAINFCGCCKTRSTAFLIQQHPIYTPVVNSYGQQQQLGIAPQMMNTTPYHLPPYQQDVPLAPQSYTQQPPPYKP